MSIKLPGWLKWNKLYFIKNLQEDSDVQPEGQLKEGDRTEVTSLGDANIISSEIQGSVPGYHYLFLDIDQEHVYNPSSTEGHGHLIIKHQLRDDHLEEIITVLAKYGILQAGILDRWNESHAMYLRLPGVRKGIDTANKSLKFQEILDIDAVF